MSQNERSSEVSIDLSAIDAIAADLDATADEPVKPKRKRATLKKPATDSPATEPQPAAEPTPVIDEEFREMIVHGVGQGIDFMRDGLELMEPGDTVRKGVGKCVARLLERIKPMEAGPLSDVVQIVGYLGVWVMVGKDWTKKPEDVAINVTPK